MSMLYENQPVETGGIFEIPCPCSFLFFGRRLLLLRGNLNVHKECFETTSLEMHSGKLQHLRHPGDLLFFRETNPGEASRGGMK